jgi:hypothetical protein
VKRYFGVTFVTLSVQRRLAKPPMLPPIIHQSETTKGKATAESTFPFTRRYGEIQQPFSSHFR